MILSYDYPTYTGARRVIDFRKAWLGDAAPGPGLEALPAEIRRSAAEWGTAAAQRVEKGTLTSIEAERVAALLGAIADDLDADLAGVMPVPGASFSGWQAKARLLRGMVGARRRDDPDRVAKGRADPAEARARLDALEAVYARYWEELFAWAPPEDSTDNGKAWVAEHWFNIVAADALPVAAE